MVLAFRLYGKFHWPPTNGAQKSAKETDKAATARGVIEIHFMPAGGESAAQALLRWFPHPSEPPPILPPASDYIFDLTPEEASKWFLDRKGTDCAIWIGQKAASKLKKKTWLVFQGGFLLEQYREIEQAGEQRNVLDLQWPLVESCQYYKNTTTFSLLRLYVEEKPLFRFDLNLPIPLSRTSLSGNWQNSPAFPFSVVYDTAPQAGSFLDFHALAGGWIREDAVPDPGKKIGQTSFDFTKKLPVRKRLGEFNFAKSGKNTDFAVFDDQPDVKLDRYWPENGQSFLQDILRPYGFSLNPINSTWLGKTDFGVADLSLRFSRTPDGVARRLIYRVSVRSGSERDDEDIKVDKAGLRLRLENELGGREADGVHYGASDPNTEPQYEIGGWLRTGNRLSADCELSWEIAQEAIWSENRSADWAPKVAVRLHWLEEIELGDITANRVVKDTGTKDYVFDAGLLPQANYALAKIRDSLEPGEAGQPHSFLPSFKKLKKETVRFLLRTSPFAADMDDKGLIAWGRYRNAAWRRPPLRLTLADPKQLIAGAAEVKDPARIEVQASEQSFFSQKNVTLSLELSHDPQWHPFFASFTLTVTAISNDWEGRLASLRFADQGRKTIGHNIEVTPGHLRIGGNGATSGAGHGGPVLIYPDGRAAAELRFVIPVTAIEQTSVDTSRTDRSGRLSPLLIPLPAGSPGSSVSDKPAYWLTATETLMPRDDRLIRADIYDNAGDAGDRSYVVFSSEPFTVFHFTHKPLSDRGQADNASVAFYSGDDRIWQFKKVTDTYHYTMPPQVVGESADKPGRLEIHDLPDNADLGRPPIPFASKDGLRRRAVEFRLTPPAEIWIRPSDVERGYFMPESMAHEIFRQYGAYGLGAALAYLRAEFLYGLPVGIDVSKERSIARGARIAEIEALIGRLTGPARETDAEPMLAGRWSMLRNAIARRSGRLEIWARDLDSAVAFTPARFADGVQFALRRTALHRAPVLDLSVTNGGEGPDDHVAFPKIGGIAAEQVPAHAQDHPRHHPQGLSGGALWPVESLNLFKIMLQSPQSNGGMIEAIALSPLGGDASQKAEFLGGKVSIISETRNGFVERQKVEVLGRICALWHRAKHVVVYERTVNPSAQFAPEFGTTHTRSRRPILRKVREYIELLEPERSYPDFSTAAPRSAGFLERVRFNSKIINVDSAWSSDVGDFGWQIPLWNRLSARERPQVYPMPDIAFISIAEGEGDKPVVAQQCRDPDYLFFFADFKADTSDTNLWPSRLDLDFPNMPLAHLIAKEVDAVSATDPGATGDPVPGDPDGRRRAVSRFLPGLRRFTWRLAPAAQKTAINAGRSEKPIYAGLDSVTFMRATHVAEPGGQKALPPTLRLLLIAKATLGEADDPAVTSLDYWTSDGSGTTIAKAADFAALVKDDSPLVKAIKNKDPNAVASALTELDGVWKGGFEQDVKGLVEKLNFDKFKDFKSLLPAGGAFCDKLKKDSIGLIQRKEMLVRTALQDWVADAERFVNEAELSKDGIKEKTIERLSGLAKTYLRPIFAEASNDVGKVAEAVERVRATLIDTEVEAEALIARTRQRITQFVAGYDKDKPWSEERRKAFRAGLTACLGSIAADLEAAIEEARQRLSVELNGASQAIGGHVAKALKAIAVIEADALARATYLGNAVDRLFPPIDRTIEKLLAADPSGLDALIQTVQNSKEITDNELKLRAINALKQLKTACNTARAKLADARAAAAEVDARVDLAIDTIKTTIPALRAALDGVVVPLGQSVTDLLTLAGEISNAGAKSISDNFSAISAEVGDELGAIGDSVLGSLARIGTAIDAVVLTATGWLDELLASITSDLRQIPENVLPVIADVTSALQAAQAALAPGNLLDTVIDKSIREALTVILQPVPEQFDDQAKAIAVLIRQRLDLLSETIGEKIRQLSDNALGAVGEVTTLCDALYEDVQAAEAYLQGLATDAKAYFNKQVEDAYSTLRARLGIPAIAKEDVERLVAAVDAFDYTVRGFQNNLSRAYETARAFADRAFDQFSKLDDGGVWAAPSNILKLYSAVTSAPELAALKADIDRIRADFDEFADIIETTQANALLNRFGDELKALGLSLPFDKIGDRLLPADLSNFDIGKVFRNFGGAKLDRLFKGYKIPAGIREAVRVTHDFDKKQARAWVQVDINAPMPGRRSLFSIGVFKADFVDMRLTGQIRLEASKDQDKVTETGFGRVDTAIDLVAGGQSLVRFEKFGLSFTREKGLDIEFDPKNIRLNPSFKFIQDFLSTLFPEDVGGLEVIKQDGMPVGVQHDFAIPPISLNFATSGVQNISIGNHFKLVAFPDFTLADRFNLSTIERPFIFAIFIIGGTGYIQIDAEYRPFDSELMVSVEAGAGGSASLAFAFGPFSGQIFITLSGVMTYRKVIGKSGGGLSISVVLVIAGHVDVAGIVTIGIMLMLRMTYRDNGQIDADGTLTVTIRISKFFKLKARAHVKYKLRGGKSETVVTTSASAETDPKIQEKLDKLKTAAKKLEEARS